MSSLFIVIPAYNESENIEQTIRDWYPIVESNNKEGKSRLVIINDGSKDNTLQLVKAQMKDHPLLIALDKPNGGHGSTVLYGYRYAIKITQITFSRLTLTDRPTLQNLNSSGKKETLSMPSSETVKSVVTENPESS